MSSCLVSQEDPNASRPSPSGSSQRDLVTNPHEHITASCESPLLQEKGSTPSLALWAHTSAHQPPFLLLPPSCALHATHPELGSPKAKLCKASKPWPRL